MFGVIRNMDLIEVAGSKEALSDEFTFVDVIEELKLIPSKTSLSNPFILHVLSKYKSKDEDWSAFVYFRDTIYTRNLLYNKEGAYNIVIFAWNPGQGTCIHDHAKSKCCVKVLQGNLKEVRYCPPTNTGEPLTLVGEYSHKRDDCFFVDDDCFLHQLSNGGEEQAVSMHVFVPDFHGPLNNIDPRTGQTSPDVDNPYFSISGVVCESPEA